MTELLTSPLHTEHEKLGATFTAFGPWNMPLKYQNELDEHRAVRSTAGLFDLSHMGEIWVNGADAGKFLSYAFISNFEPLKVGKAKYSMITAEDGGIIDDLITYRFEEDKFLVVPNAGNADTVWDELNKRAEDFDVTLKNESRDVAMIAVQGPKAAEILVPLVEDNKQDEVYNLGYYAATMGKVARTFAIIARTGYTGEDGFELIVYNSDAPQLWEELLKAGEEYDIKPCGLAARDSLRLEAGMPLYGNELSRDITPVEAWPVPLPRRRPISSAPRSSASAPPKAHRWRSPASPPRSAAPRAPEPKYSWETRRSEPSPPASLPPPWDTQWPSRCWKPAANSSPAPKSR